MNNRTRNILGFVLVLVLLFAAGFYIFKRDIGSVNIPRDGEIANTTPAEVLAGFDLPDGFSLSIFADDVPGVRAIELDSKGRFLVSQPSEGKISVIIDDNFDHTADSVKTLASGLTNPHGLAFRCEEVCHLYVAESDVLSRYVYNADQISISAREELMPIEYSLTDNHKTRSIIFLPSPEEDTLLVSAGSSCNVCHEDDTDHAAIISYNIKTGKKELYAKGLRNAVFMTLDPVSGQVFATEMGRDGLGDNVPPDEINIIKGPSTSSGQSSIPNFGWPICYGKNIHDTQFDKNTYIRNPCMEPFETESFVDLQAHSAPLGLAFIPEEGWPEEYWYNLLVAYHGSWNRSVPTGYKIVRIKMNSKGEYLGTEDFITGWLTSEGDLPAGEAGKLGRPVDIKIFPGGTAYISDDERGVIYRVWKTK